MGSLNSVAGSKRNGLTPTARWSPAFYTPRISRASDGDEIIRFAEEHFVVLKGFRACQPLRFTP